MHDVWAFEQMKTDAEWSSEWYQILEHDGIVIEFTPGLVSVVPMFDVGSETWWRPPAAAGAGGIGVNHTFDARLAAKLNDALEDAERVAEVLWEADADG